VVAADVDLAHLVRAHQRHVARPRTREPVREAGERRRPGYSELVVRATRSAGAAVDVREPDVAVVADAPAEAETRRPLTQDITRRAGLGAGGRPAGEEALCCPRVRIEPGLLRQLGRARPRCPTAGLLDVPVHRKGARVAERERLRPRL